MINSTTECSAIEIARRYLSGFDVSHDIAHVKRVVLNAKRIFQELEDHDALDLNIVIAIAALHDCLDKKYIGSDSIEQKRAQLHREIVEELRFTTEQAQFILKTVDNVSYSTELAGGEAATSTCPYLAIVRDADRLEAIGAIGAARCFAFSAAKNRLLATEDFEIERRMREAYLSGEPMSSASHGNESAIVHFYDKLVNLLPRFKTAPGKKLAQQRHDFILAFLDQIHDEMAVI